MAGYIYLPVPTPQMFVFAETWREGQVEKGKTPYEILYGPEKGVLKGLARRAGKGCLKKVSVLDKLYVLCHGADVGSRKIGAPRGVDFDGIPVQGGQLKSYFPHEMAQVLQSEGLLPGHIDLRLFVCGSGNVPPIPGETKSYAEKLSLALKDLGYCMIRVTGYQGSVLPAYEYRKLENWRELDYTPDKHRGVTIGDHTFPASTKKIVF